MSILAWEERGPENHKDGKVCWSLLSETIPVNGEPACYFIVYLSGRGRKTYRWGLRSIMSQNIFVENTFVDSFEAAEKACQEHFSCLNRLN